VINGRALVRPPYGMVLEQSGMQSEPQPFRVERMQTTQEILTAC